MLVNLCGTTYRNNIIDSAENLNLGMSMCVKAIEVDGLKFILAGFEDGKISCWDIRNPQEELSSIQLFPEPGIISIYSHALMKLMLNHLCFSNVPRLQY